MIEIRNLRKSFGEKLIFDNFNYLINAGIMLAVVGKSGSGKSTLLNIIGLLDHNYAGEVIYNNINISKEKEKNIIKYIRENISYLFQNYALVENENVEYNLLLALEYEKMSKEEKKERTKDALKMVGLENYNKKKVYTLSGGEQQRVALARVILKRGDIVLADEPTGNLDKENSLKVIEILKNLRKMGKTVIIVTHDENLAKECDDIIRL